MPTHQSLETQRTAHIRRGNIWLPGRLHRRGGALRRQTGHHHLRQSNWRRFSSWRVRRCKEDYGFRGARRSGVSGGNPERQPSRHGRRTCSVGVVPDAWFLRTTSPKNIRLRRRPNRLRAGERLPHARPPHRQHLLVGLWQRAHHPL